MNGLDQIRTVGEFASDGFDVHVNRAHLAVGIVDMARCCQLLAIKHLAWLTGQRPQQSKLGRRQIQLTAIDPRVMPEPVYLQPLTRDPLASVSPRLRP